MTTTLITTHNDKSSDFGPSDYCPGFNLWDVLASDGRHYLMAGDHISGVSTRLYFRAELEVVEAVDLGPNPAVALWDARALAPAVKTARCAMCGNHGQIVGRSTICRICDGE